VSIRGAPALGRRLGCPRATHQWGRIPAAHDSDLIGAEIGDEHVAGERTGPRAPVPRDLRSSYITLRVYKGVPLTTISKEVGTNVQMIEQHCAGVIENWDGQRIAAEDQIRTAREQRTLRSTG
jgi:hypothetical protein